MKAEGASGGAGGKNERAPPSPLGGVAIQAAAQSMGEPKGSPKCLSSDQGHRPTGKGLPLYHVTVGSAQTRTQPKVSGSVLDLRKIMALIKEGEA